VCSSDLRFRMNSQTSSLVHLLQLLKHKLGLCAFPAAV
jgi:hypothetical protein